MKAASRGVRQGRQGQKAEPADKVTGGVLSGQRAQNAGRAGCVPLPGPNQSLPFLGHLFRVLSVAPFRGLSFLWAALSLNFCVTTSYT